MKQQNSTAIYEAMAELTGQMLTAAKQQDWDKVADLENCNAQLVEQLKVFKNIEPLSASAADRKMTSIKRMLADDREIRNLVSPKMAKLSALISSTQTGKKATRAYSQ
jgi:flagellar protein FliT